MHVLQPLRGVRFLALYAWLALFNCGPLHAASADVTGKISQLMEASGINHGLRQVLPSILSGFDGDGSRQPIPVNIRAGLRDAAIQGFQMVPMQEKVRAKMSSALSEKQIDDVLVWLDAPLGRRITALENAANDPAAAPKMQAYAAEVQRNPARDSRIQLIRELNRASGAEDMMNTITEATALASTLGINAAQPVQRQIPAERIRKLIKDNMPRIHKQTAQFAMLAFLYTYRELSDQEVETYLKFAKSASGVAYHKSSATGFTDALLEAVARFMEAIPNAIKRSKGSVGV
jgi:hypothetical protein